MADIANYIYEHPQALNLSLTGFWVSDRTYYVMSYFLRYALTKAWAAVLGWDVVQEQIPAVDFVHKYENVFSFKYAHYPLLLHAALLTDRARSTQ